jgi:hypothetical protein
MADNQHIIWKNCVDKLSEFIAYLERKSQQANNLFEAIIDSQYFGYEVELFTKSKELTTKTSSEVIKSNLYNMSKKLLVFPSETYVNSDNTKISLSEYLEQNNFKISRLITSLCGIEIDESYLYDEGYWEISTVIIDKYGSPCNYYFELDIATDENLQNIVARLDSHSNQEGWFYQKQDNSYYSQNENGVPSWYIGYKVKFQSTSSLLLTRYETYYTRLRQYIYNGSIKTTYDYVENSIIIYT